MPSLTLVSSIQIVSEWPLELMGDENFEPGLIDRRELLHLVKKIDSAITDEQVRLKFESKVRLR